MTKPFQNPDQPARLVVINAGVSDPSSTRLLADRIAQQSLDRLSATGLATSLAIIDLAPLAIDIAKAIVAGFPGENCRRRSIPSPAPTRSSPQRRSTRPG